ncbi:MAG: hypothetical protein LOD90_04545 [Symbiobacteriaceae bacterium]
MKFALRGAGALCFLAALLAGGPVLAGAALDLSLRSARRQIARVPAVG